MSILLTIILVGSAIVLSILSVLVFVNAPFTTLSTLLLVTTAVLWVIIFSKALFDEFIQNTNYQIALIILGVIAFVYMRWRRRAISGVKRG